MVGSPRIQQFAALPPVGKVLVLVAMLACLGGGYYSVFHTNLEADIGQAQRQHQQLQDELRAAQARNQTFLELQAQLTQREVAERRQLRVLPVDAEIPAFLADLHRLAEASGLRLDVVQPRPEQEEAFFVKVPVALQLRGPYHQLVKFFYNVSQLERAVSMEELSLTDPVVEADGVFLKVKVLATTYRRRSEESQPAAQHTPAPGHKG